MRIKKPERWGLVVVVAVYLVLSGYRLREMPGEWFGDISILHEEVVDILKRPLDWKFNLSAGPLYHHVVAGLAVVMGATYETYKIASVLTGLAGILLIYLLARELHSVRLGWLTAAVAAVSYWYLIWSRLGSSPQILSPVLTAGSVYLLAVYRRTRQWWVAVIGMGVAGLGLFSYPATFVLPVAYFGLLVWELMGGKKKGEWGKALGGSFLVLAFLAWGFSRVVVKQPDLFARGYIGEKVFNAKGTPVALASLVFKNGVKTLGMFHVRGDQGFRINVVNHPHLDLVSGFCMVVGGVWLWMDKRWRGKRAYIMVPFFLLLTPSLSPGIPAAEIPSASRTFGVVPWVYLLAGIGLEAIVWQLLPMIADWVPRWMVAGSVWGLIGFLNTSLYFGAYLQGLPNHNQPWGWEIAKFVDALPATTVVKLTDCCWGEWGQPEPKGMYYVLRRQAGRRNIVDDYPFVSTCGEIRAGTDYALIMRPDNQVLIRQFRECFPGAVGEMHLDGLGQPAFYSLMVGKR